MFRRSTKLAVPALFAPTNMRLFPKGSPEEATAKTAAADNNHGTTTTTTTTGDTGEEVRSTAIAAVEIAHKAALAKKESRDDSDRHKQLSFRSGKSAALSFTEADRRLSMAHTQKPSARSQMFETALLILVLGGGGTLAYNYVTYNGPRFDQALVRAKIRDQLERRPDLAPTFIRTAFLVAAKRAGVDTDLIGESCACEAGLQEVLGILEVQCHFSTIGTSDIVVLAALESIKLLRGPTEKSVNADSPLEFTWNRWDTKPDEEILREKEEAAAKLLLLQQEEGKKEAPDGQEGNSSSTATSSSPSPSSPSSSTVAGDNNNNVVVGTQDNNKEDDARCPRPRVEAGVLSDAQKRRVRRDDIIAWAIQKGEMTPTIDEYLKKNKRTLRTVDEILMAIDPSFTTAEKVALMGCHGIGEYHPHVSGFDGTTGTMRCAYTRREQFTLDNHYYKRLLDFEGKWTPVDNKDNNHGGGGSGSQGVIVPAMKSVWVTPPNKPDGSRRKRRQLVITAREEEAILGNPVWKVEAQKFAADNDLFHAALASAFQKMVDSNFGPDIIRAYPPELM